MSFPRISLILAGVSFLALGVVVLVAPEDLMRFAGLPADRPASVVELEARYGGLHVALGLFFLISSFRFRWVRAALGAQILVFGGLAAGRLAGLLQSPVRNRIQILYLSLECLGAALGFVGFRQAKTLLLNSRTPSL
jgi:hypothetical protein